MSRSTIGYYDLKLFFFKRMWKCEDETYDVDNDNLDNGDIKSFISLIKVLKPYKLIYYRPVAESIEEVSHSDIM